MFFGILRFQPRFRCVVLLRGTLLGVWRRRGCEPELLLELALGLLAAPHRFGDQFVRQNQSGLRDVFHDQRNIRVFAGAHIVTAKVHFVTLDAVEHAAKSFAALERCRHLDFHQMTGIALEIGPPNQRPVDSWRGNFQPVGPVDRIGDIEHRRQRPRHRLAILDLHRAVGAFGHDLHRAAGLAGNPDPHQPVTHALQDRSGNGRHPGGDPRLDHQARLGQ